MISKRPINRSKPKRSPAIDSGQRRCAGRGQLDAIQDGLEVVQPHRRLDLVDLRVRSSTLRLEAANARLPTLRLESGIVSDDLLRLHLVGRDLGRRLRRTAGPSAGRPSRSCPRPAPCEAGGGSAEDVHSRLRHGVKGRIDASRATVELAWAEYDRHGTVITLPIVCSFEPSFMKHTVGRPCQRDVNASLAFRLDRGVRQRPRAADRASPRWRWQVAIAAARRPGGVRHGRHGGPRFRHLDAAGIRPRPQFERELEPNFEPRFEPGAEPARVADGSRPSSTSGTARRRTTGPGATGTRTRIQPPGDIASQFYPERGPYSSRDPAVLDGPDGRSSCPPGSA